MKILHTADWHLGHRLHEQSQFEEQSAFLKWLEQYIIEQAVDILLVSGDVFDTGAPSAQSLELYYNFLVRLQRTSCKHIIITGGNHDAPAQLNAPRELLAALSITVIGKATENIADEIVELTLGEERVLIAAVPYLRDQDIRKAVAGETFEQLGDRYKHALVQHYNDAAAACEERMEAAYPVIAMGHLFAVGGNTSDSEQTIYVGNLGDIGAEDFPEVFDYVALGHLHRPQLVGKREHIRYSGSPYALSFSEAGYSKAVVVLAIEQRQISAIEEVALPIYRALHRIKGTLEEVLNQLRDIDAQSATTTPWVEVTLTGETITTAELTELQREAEELSLQVLKVLQEGSGSSVGLEQLIAKTRDVKELSPLEVFEMKCTEDEVDLANEKHADTLDAFREVLQLAQSNE